MQGAEVIEMAENYHGAQGPHLPELTPLFFYSRIEWSGNLHSTLNSLPLHFF